MKILLAIVVLFAALTSDASAQSIPKTFVLKGTTLELRRKEISARPDSSYASAVKGLRLRADRIVSAGKMYSVMDKSVVPPSGNKHDYMSQAPYWWPDPAQSNGLPYVRRDGERNPELSKISDHEELDTLIDETECLSVAYFFSKDEKYARYAASLLRTWFIDQKTRQNPNLNFAQGIPGINTGRGIGLIETRNLFKVIDSAILLRESRSWTSAEHERLKAWFGEFLKWMLDSPLGKDEADERNNHGTYYDVQIVAYALFTGEKAIAKRQLETTKGRIASQIETDGRQPHELARTLSWNYANMNLLGFFILARLGESVDVDLWNYKTADGRGIRRSFEWIAAHAEKKEWTYQQIKPRTFELTVSLFKIAATKYKNAEYRLSADRLEVKQDEMNVLDLN